MSIEVCAMLLSRTSIYTYGKLNELKSAPGVLMFYDPGGRMIEYDTSVSTRFAYAGSVMIAEIANPAGAILRRYVPGPGTDGPLVWYEGSGTTDRRWLHADERGSVVTLSDSTGAMLAINRYDEYGIPRLANAGRFQYTGQAWLPELGMYNYKARIYSPTLGRFMQTDPIGYGDGLGWYNYVGSDPVNGSDPSGKDIVVTGPHLTSPGFNPPSCLACNWGGDYINSKSSGAWLADHFDGSDGRIYKHDLDIDSAIARRQRANRVGPQRVQCPGIPRVGPGKSTLDKNIRDARNDRPSTRAGRQNGGMLNLIRLSRRVTGDQNYKANPSYRGSAPFGNFNFGATMQARGFSLEDALGYSNSFQLMTTDRYDPPEDVADVTNGFNYAARGCGGQ